MSVVGNSPGELLERLIVSITSGATACHLDGSLVNEVGGAVDENTLEAKSAEQILVESFDPSRRRLLDYGCGAAHHRKFIEDIGYIWTGADVIESVSPLVKDDVAARAGEIALYDGWTLPFPDESFDVVYSMLVFQHVRDISRSFSELGRVLAPGGLVIGQVSSMEQMQDYGTFNFTPFGMKVAAQAGGLKLEKIYPKHDVFSFLARRLMITLGASDDNELTDFLNPDGFVQNALVEVGARLKLSFRDINLLRLKFSMQYVFVLQK